MLLILETVYFTGYADGNIHFAVADNIKDVIPFLEEVCKNLFTWFFNNQMMLISEKCHLLLNTKDEATLKVDNLQIKVLVFSCLLVAYNNYLWKKLLGINFDYNLNFAKHIKDICQKYQES